MQLREFTLIPPTIEAGQVFKAIESAIPIESIHDTIAQSKANAPVCGYPGTRSGYPAAFPKVRLVLLIEAGTHLGTDARIGLYRMGERRRALKRLRSIGSGMWLMWDRGLHSFRLVQTTLNQGGHDLRRVPANVKLEVEPAAILILKNGVFETLT